MEGHALADLQNHLIVLLLKGADLGADFSGNVVAQRRLENVGRGNLSGLRILQKRVHGSRVVVQRHAQLAPVFRFSCGGLFLLIRRGFRLARSLGALRRLSASGRLGRGRLPSS